MIYKIKQEEVHKRYRRLGIMVTCIILTVGLMTWINQSDDLTGWFFTMSITSALSGATAYFSAKHAMRYITEFPVSVSDDAIRFPYASGLCEIEPGAIQQVAIFSQGSHVNKIIIQFNKGSKTPLIGYEKMDELAEEIRSRVPKNIILEH
ncbi:MAG: hypothetical protein JJU29_21510 [Verrucomicrobia bacterium]|nr:hypothetical protein [Verrucomicrobiota bacterium]MCH8512371.1 hypothetical protein [Kiritimatiellia bacterium]